MFKKLVYFIYDKFITKPKDIRKLICVASNGTYIYLTISFRSENQTPLLLVIIEEEFRGKSEYATIYYQFM